MSRFALYKYTKINAYKLPTQRNIDYNAPEYFAKKNGDVILNNIATY